MKTFVASVVCCSLALTAVSDEATLMLDGDHFVTVAESSTQTISAKVTGLGRIVLNGGGTLVLSNAENDFTGGIVVSNGIIRADASGAFGTGTISLEGENKAHVRQIRLNAAKGVFANPVMLRLIETTGNVLYAMQSAEFRGDIHTWPEYTGSKYFICGTASASVSVTFGGDIEVPYLRLEGKGKYICKGKVSVSGTLIAGNASEDYGHLTLANPGNEINQLTVKAFRIYCRDKNVIFRSTIFFDYNWHGNTAQRGCIFLEGFDQEFKVLNYRKENSYKLLSRDDSCVTVFTPDDKPATVTLSGPGAAYGYCRLAGPVSMVIDLIKAEGATMYQRFLYRYNSMGGDFTVKNGSCYFTEGVEFPSMVNYTHTGGTLNCENVTNCLRGLRNMVVSGGYVMFNSGCVDVTGARTRLYLSSQAKFCCHSGLTNTVRNLYLDGRKMPAGIYTYENLLPMQHPTKIDEYSGVIRVTHGPSFAIKVK